MTEAAENTETYSVELIPDVILHLVENNGFLDDVKSMLCLRLINKTWNETLCPLVWSRMVTVLSETNLSSFSQFLSNPAYKELHESNIRFVILDLRSEVPCQNTLNGFIELPSFFRSQLLRFQLNFELYYPPQVGQVWTFLRKARIDFLEELELVVEKRKEYHSLAFPFPLSRDSNSFEHIIFQFLRKLTIPHHFIHLLHVCPALTHLSLHVFYSPLDSRFWHAFRFAICANRLNRSIDELFFVDKQNVASRYGTKNNYSFTHLIECNFRLKKLGLGLPFPYGRVVAAEEKQNLFSFLAQQSDTLDYLETPSNPYYYSPENAFVSDVLCLPKLAEIKLGYSTDLMSTNLFAKCPPIEKMSLSSLDWTFMDHYISPGIVKHLQICRFDVSHFERLFRIFPNLYKLDVLDTTTHQFLLTKILTHGTRLKELSIQIHLATINGQTLKSVFERNYYKLCIAGSDARRKVCGQAVMADPFIVGLEPSRCKPFLCGQVAFDDTTEFPDPSGPSIKNLHNLECLRLEGYFTELTLWAGIKKLTKLKELHVKTEHLLHPATLIKLESYLHKLRSWSYTKLAEEKYGYREMYKYFRFPHSILTLDQFHIWKYNDFGMEKKIVTLDEFDGLDLSYTGTRDQLVPKEFWPELHSECEYVA